MAKGVLTRLGEDSFLRDSEPCRVNIEHGVQTFGLDSDQVVERSVATIESSMNPKVGDALAHPDGNYRLDAIHADSGALKRFVLLPRP